MTRRYVPCQGRRTTSRHAPSDGQRALSCAGRHAAAPHAGPGPRAGAIRHHSGRMASTAATLSYHRGGTGEPLLLLHGIGGSWRHWRPVLPALEAERDVVAVDLPGFGASPVLARGAEPTPAALAEAVAGLLDALGWEAPHVAGNSLGGWVALELAKLGRARSVCALSPAGFATPREAAYAARVLALMHRVARLAGDRVDLLMRNPAMRALATGLIVARPGRMPADDGRCGPPPPVHRARARARGHHDRVGRARPAALAPPARPRPPPAPARPAPHAGRLRPRPHVGRPGHGRRRDPHLRLTRPAR